MDTIRSKLKDPGTLLFITAVFGSILYISLIFNDNLWVDEAFTASIIRKDLPFLINDTIKDTLPPFYNLYGKLLTTVFGYSSYVMKFASASAMILLIFFVGRLLFSVSGFRAAWFFELFLFTMPYFLHYAVEIRMYSFGMLCCGMAAGCFLSILKDSSRVKAFVLFTVFAGYVHHFALVSCGMMWFILLILIAVRKNKEEFLLFLKNLLLFLVLYFPGLILSVYQIKNASSYFSMAPLSLKSLLGDLRYPFVTNITPLSAVLALVTAGAVIFSLREVRISSLRESGFFPGLLLMSVFLLTLGFGYFSSLLAGRSIFTARYLSPCLPVFWMGVSLLFDSCLNKTEDNRILMSLILFMTAAAGVFGYAGMYREEYRPGVSDMKACFNENTKEGDEFLVFEDNYEIELCFRYYFPWLKKTSLKKAGEATGRLFLLKTGENDLERCREYGYNPIYIGDYSFDRYSFSLFELEKDASG